MSYVISVIGLVIIGVLMLGSIFVWLQSETFYEDSRIGQWWKKVMRRLMEV